MIVIALILGLFAALMGIGWIVEGNQFFMYQFFAPKYEQVRRNTFEQSRAFNEGMAQELNQMYRDYIHTKDDNEKAAIRSIIKDRVAGYDIDNLNNPQVRRFIQQILQGE